MADPLVHDRISATLARCIVAGGEHVRAMAGNWTVPTLLLCAGADRCVAPRGSDAFATMAPPAVVQAQRYEGFSHEILNEPEREQVLDQLVAWLDRHVPAGTA